MGFEFPISVTKLVQILLVSVTSPFVGPLRNGFLVLQFLSHESIIIHGMIL